MFANIIFRLKLLLILRVFKSHFFVNKAHKLIHLKKLNKTCSFDFSFFIFACIFSWYSLDNYLLTTSYWTNQLIDQSF